jgi:hypothetical protein
METTLSAGVYRNIAAEFRIPVITNSYGLPLTLSKGKEACLFGFALAQRSKAVLGDTFPRSAYVFHELAFWSKPTPKHKHKSKNHSGLDTAAWTRLGAPVRLLFFDWASKDNAPSDNSTRVELQQGRRERNTCSMPRKVLNLIYACPS